jgi:proteasome beta subunit
MEKVVQADEFSGVAIAGTAGPAMEMIKVFQLQLEYYEKVEGQPLSLEGKANQLSMLVRQNLPAALQAGIVVVPLFAGFDPLAGRGRLWDFDITGGRYEERDFVATGSGSTLASTVLRLGWRQGLTRDEAVALAARSLWEAADADAATGGPDVLRGIYPIVASIDSTGWSRVADATLAATYDTIMGEVRKR